LFLCCSLFPSQIVSRAAFLSFTPWKEFCHEVRTSGRRRNKKFRHKHCPSQLPFIYSVAFCPCFPSSAPDAIIHSIRKLKTENYGNSTKSTGMATGCRSTHILPKPSSTFPKTKAHIFQRGLFPTRSEERRVGKESI